MRKVAWLLVAALAVLALGSACHSQDLLPLGTWFSPLQEGVARLVSLVCPTKPSDAEEKLNELRRRVTELESAKRENEWYRSLLGIQKATAGKTLLQAAVIAIGNDETFIVNAGTTDGVTVGAPVLTDAGVIGTVAKAGLTDCLVRTLFHPSVKVSVTVSRTGETGTVSSENGNLTVCLLTRTPKAQKGDLLITSGYGGVYPAGILLGTAGEFSPSADGVSSMAAVAAFAELLPAMPVVIVL